MSDLEQQRGPTTGRSWVTVFVIGAAVAVIGILVLVLAIVW